MLVLLSLSLGGGDLVVLGVLGVLVLVHSLCVGFLSELLGQQVVSAVALAHLSELALFAESLDVLQ